MNESVRCQLYTFHRNGEFAALETYCKKLLCNETDALLRGCLLWNLSDVYAVRREAEALYHNHRLFEAHVQTMPAMYRLWLVSDGTQRLTLELGGYDDFWWKIYENATTQYNHAYEAVLFEAHRAAFYKSPQMPYDHNRAVWVKERFRSFLESAYNSPSAAFYRLIYTALCIKHFGESEQDIIACCEPLLDDLCYPVEEPIYALGEWDALNRHRSRRTQAQVGINNAVNALIDSGNVKQAYKLYKTACECGLNVNDYIEQRL